MRIYLCLFWCPEKAICNAIGNLCAAMPNVAVAAAIKYRNVSLSSQAELSFHYERNQLTQSQIIIWT